MQSNSRSVDSNVFSAFHHGWQSYDERRKTRAKHRMVYTRDGLLWRSLRFLALTRSLSIRVYACFHYS